MPTSKVIGALHAVKMPTLGVGLWNISPPEIDGLVKKSLALGYKLFDTAQGYENEQALGLAIKKHARPESEIFVTTKVMNSNHGYWNTMHSVQNSLSKLNTHIIDQVLIHWPFASNGKYLETWQALIDLRRLGYVRTIGVSNFEIPHLNQLINQSGIVPAINQIELHPFFQQNELRAFHSTHDIATVSSSPFGRGSVFGSSRIRSIAKLSGLDIGQLVLAWHRHLGNIAIPKTVTPLRLENNFKSLGITLSFKTMKELEKLDSFEGRIGKKANAS